MRLLCEASFCFFYVLIFLYYKKGGYEKYIFGIATFCLLFNSLYAIKSHDFFLDRRQEIGLQLSTLKGKKYFYDDTKNVQKVTTYTIPIINKKFNFTHKSLQSGGINSNIIFSIDPTIIYIEQDTVRDKTKIIYNSSIK